MSTCTSIVTDIQYTIYVMKNNNVCWALHVRDFSRSLRAYHSCGRARAWARASHDKDWYTHAQKNRSTHTHAQTQIQTQTHTHAHIFETITWCYRDFILISIVVNRNVFLRLLYTFQLIWGVVFILLDYTWEKIKQYFS